MPRVICLLLLAALLLCACQAQADHTPPATATMPEDTVSTAPKADFSYIQPENHPVPTAVRFEPESASPAERLLQTMTTEEKVGQLFLARCPGDAAVQDLQTYHLGGYILFGRDFAGQTPQSMTETLASYQQAAKIPILIAVDEEGGTVARVSSYQAFRPSRFSSPRSLYAQGGLPLLLDTEVEKCQLLRALGIHANLAPVCDITTNPRSFMYSRSLGLSPAQTAEAIAAMVSVSRQQQIGSVLKHFPGYGNNTDTHTGIAVDKRSLTELESADLLPFAAGIQAGCGAIMVSHTFVVAMDPGYPASLSLSIHRYLRNRMGFDGVIVTDDLAMGAITDLYGAEEAAVMAVLAGNDLLCCSDYQVQYQAVLDAVRAGRINEQILNQAVRRVLLWKQSLGLLS